MVATGFAHNNGGWVSRAYRLVDRFAITPEQGALTTLHCATSAQAGRETGLYYTKSKVREAGALAQDVELARKLWQQSEAWVDASA